MVPQFQDVVTVANPSVTVSEQVEPLGMGDAIFGAETHWSGFESILIVWGDQVNLSENTLRKVIARSHPKQTIVLPLVRLSSPYVQYDVRGDVLEGVRQAREGDTMDPTGLSDVGVFMLSVQDLVPCWTRFAGQSALGTVTGEVNFLPFLPFLCREYGWRLRTVDVTDPIEARGVNTPEDLQFARERLSKGTKK
jgi:bifunctional N-acetylglucosamine-1-phosphate-uridyltransferase/glucosamine-1-phosphate-acetyltransferase GlmU-like protein